MAIYFVGFCLRIPFFYFNAPNKLYQKTFHWLLLQSGNKPLILSSLSFYIIYLLGTSLLANNPQLMSMLQGRLGNLVGAPSGYVQTLPADVRRRVKGLKSLQHKHAVLEADFQKEILALEKKFLALYTPLYQKRAEFVSGKAEPTDAEVEEGVSEDEDEEEEEDDDEDKDAEKVEGKNWCPIHTSNGRMNCITSID